MIAGPLDLEDFASGEAAEPARSAEYLKGEAAGRTAALAEVESQHKRAMVELSSRLTDMTFGVAEAEAHLTRILEGLLRQVAELILPEIAKESFGAHLSEVLCATFQDAARRPIPIRVAPDLVAALQIELDAADGLRLAFEGDDQLAEGEALIGDADATVLVDLPSLVSHLQDALRGFETLERTGTDD